MAGTPIGRVLLIPQGDYNGATTYNMLDCVRDNGATWVCKVDGTVGIAPPTLPTTSNANWQLLAADGAVTGSVNWNNVNYKPFDTIGNGLNVTVTDELELDASMLVASNLSYDNTSSGASSNDVQSALDELFRGGGGGGLLPYFYIDSEAGATVTVTAPDGSTITPTASGSGHWECSVPMYGTYTIHSVLAGQGDATASVTVDDVKEYHITDNHYDFTINVTAPSGSTIRITGNGETYTGTGTGSSQAFAVHTASTTYTVAVTMDGNTKTDTITSAATTGGSGSVSIEFGTITVSVDAAFVSAGSSITCVNGGTSCTAKTAASTVTFNPPTTGTWTISGEISGTTYTTTATVSSLSTAVTANLQTVPDGSTVLPTDDIQTWLNCAGIYNKTSYTTLADVLGDSTTLLALMSDNNAVDYLVRSKTWITGAGLIPAMTSNTTPEGVASASSIYSSSYPEYYAFDGNSSTTWAPNGSDAVNSAYIGYKFTKAHIVRKIHLVQSTSCPVTKVKLVGSNDDFATSDVIKDNITLSTYDEEISVLTNITPYDSYRLYITELKSGYSIGNVEIAEIQFYTLDGIGICDDSTAMTDIGANNYCANTLLADSDWCDGIVNSSYVESVMNVKVPTMTSNTAPSGEAFSLNVYTTGREPFRAFDNVPNTSYSSSNGQQGEYIGYDFGKQVNIKGLLIRGIQGYGTSLIVFSLQGSNTDKTSGYTDIATDIDYDQRGSVTPEVRLDLPNNTSLYRYYRLYITNNPTNNMNIDTIQFYGREDV